MRSFTGMSGRFPLMSVQVGGTAVALVVAKTWPGVVPQPAQAPNPEKVTNAVLPVESLRSVRTAVTWRGGSGAASISVQVEATPAVAFSDSHTFPLLVPTRTLPEF